VAHKETHKLLLELRRQLDELDLTDHEGKESAEKMAELIDSAVGSEEAGTEVHHELRKLLKDSVLHFEVSHPNLTATINNVVNTLNNLGI